MLTAAEKLSEWRTKKKKCTQAAAAKLVGVSAATWCDWESGKKIPRVDRAQDIERLTKTVKVADWATSARLKDAGEVTEKTAANG